MSIKELLNKTAAQIAAEIMNSMHGPASDYICQDSRTCQIVADLMNSVHKEE